MQSQDDRIEKIIQSLQSHQHELAHHFKNYIEAFRLLIGAHASGEVDDISFRNAVSELHIRFSGQTDESSLKEVLNPYLDSQQAYLTEVQPASRENIRSKFQGKKILLIDDLYQKAGWDVVFRTLFGPEVCEFASSSNQAEQRLKEQGNIFDVIFLDLLLPDDVHQGLEVLSLIKEELMLLNTSVIVFTALGTSQYVKRCFELGAEDYYAKYFEEESKDYLGYYKRFRGVITNALRSREERNPYWGAISDLQTYVESSGSHEYPDVFKYLRKAYYFLTLPDDWLEYRVLLLNDKTTHFGEVILQLANAAELLLGKLLDRNKNNRDVKQYIKVKGEPRMFGETLWCLNSCRIVTRDESEYFNELNDLRTIVVHSERKKGLRIEKETAREHFLKAIDHLERLYQRL